MYINKNLAISESGFIFNPLTGDSFSTNTTGLEIIKILKEEVDPEKILERMVDKFAIDQQTVEKDLMDFIQVLKNYQILNHEQ